MILLHHYDRSYLNLAVAITHHNLQQVRINPKYENVLRNKVTPRSMQSFNSGSSLTTFCINAEVT
jgi:hypothetical protein